MNRKVLIAGLLVTIPIVAVLLANLGRDPQDIKSPLIGRAAPQFELREAGGDRVISLAQFRGKPVVINFWATWCVPCYSEHPVLTASAAALRDRVQFLGVAYEDTEEKINQFIRENGGGYPTVIDDGGKTAIAYGVFGVPETFFINAEGKIVTKYKGALTVEALEQNVQYAMAAR